MNRATPLLFSLGQHAALNAISASLLRGYVVCQPHRVLDVHHLMSTKLWAHSKISLHRGKTKIWRNLPKGMRAFAGNGNIAEPKSKGVERRPDFANSTARPRCVGTPLGHADFVRSHLESVREEQDVLLDRIPVVPNLQAAWLLLSHCAATRANFVLRTVRPELAMDYAVSHDRAIWRCMTQILGIHAECARTFPPDSSISIVHGRAQTPECFTMSSWSPLGELGGRN